MADGTRRSGDPRQAAEAAFKKATTRPADAPPAARSDFIPHAKEQVTLRIDRDVLERFQESGPGWQDRLNLVLRKACGL